MSLSWRCCSTGPIQSRASVGTDAAPEAAAERGEVGRESEQQALKTRGGDGFARRPGQPFAAPRCARAQAGNAALAAKLGGNFGQRFGGEHVTIARRTENRAQPAQLLRQGSDRRPPG